MARQIVLKDIHISTLKSVDNTATVYESPMKLERAICAGIKSCKRSSY